MAATDSIADISRKFMDDTSASGAITTQNLVPAGAATAGSAVEIDLNGKDTLSVQVGGTYTGVLSIQATVNGTVWVTLSGPSYITNLATGAQTASIASASVGIFQLGVGGFLKARVTGLAAMTGSATINLYATDGNSYVALDQPLPAGTAAIGSVTTTPTTGSGYNLVTAATTNAASIKGSAGALYEVTVSNVTATAAFVKFYSKNVAPTVGTDVPILTISAPANSLVAFEFGAVGKRFTAGIAIAVTGLIAATDATATVAGIQVNATYI